MALKRISRSLLLKKEPLKPLKIKEDPVDGEEFPAFHYGKFTFDYAINFAGVSISLEQTRSLYHYRRVLGNRTREANISVKDGRMFIHPIEPLYIPDAVTDFLEVSFDEIMIEPMGKTVVFLTFPIEIGVFIESKGKTDIIDTFTYKTPKFSLYGAANRGVITRWHKSGTYYYPPKVKNYEEGLLRLHIENTTSDWVTVSRVILYEKGMHIYFDDRVVSMAAQMMIIREDAAEVLGVDRPLNDEMSRSLRMYKPRRSSGFSNIPGAVVDSLFLMDAGLN